MITRNKNMQINADECRQKKKGEVQMDMKT